MGAGSSIRLGGGNYLELSIRHVHFRAVKASRLGYIDAKCAAVGRRAYQGILKEFIEVAKTVLVNIHRVCRWQAWRRSRKG